MTAQLIDGKAITQYVRMEIENDERLALKWSAVGRKSQFHNEEERLRMGDIHPSLPDVK